MDALVYLMKRTIINRIKYALRKPVTYVWLAFILFYVFLIPYSFKVLVTEMQMESPSGMAAAMALMAFWMIPVNLISYAKRKGLLYTKSDVHFLFPSPITPKKVLLFAHVKGLLMNVLLSILGTLLGGYLFKVDVPRLVIFFLFSLVFENLLEGSMMLLLYGSEKITDTARKWIIRLTYGLLGLLVLIGLYTLSTQGVNLAGVLSFLHSDLVQMVPIIGWYIAVMHLIFVGPSTITIVGTVLYLVTMVVLVFFALRMKCTGEYYEDAMKFADDYAELVTKRKSGITEARMGKKEKFKKAEVAYKGSGAKALFYRQLLEYKKSRFFIFDVNTVVAIIAAAFIIFLYFDEGGFGDATPFMIPGIMAYLIFILTNMSGKWGKELRYPYTYLIPDAPFKKLFYATLMQLIQAAVNGAILAVPTGIVLGYHPVTILLCVLAYVVLSGAKLYSLTVTEVFTGNVLGTTGKQFFQLLIMGIVIGFGVLGAIAGMLLAGEMLAYVMMIVFVGMLNVVLMILAAQNFEKMETV